MEENESTVHLKSPTFTIKELPDSKIIIINPINTTNCQDISEISSVALQLKQSYSSQQKQLNQPPKIAFINHRGESWVQQQQEDDESMRKLYKQLKRQERQREVVQNEVQFLYKSSRGEEVSKVQERYQQQQYIQSEQQDQKHEDQLIMYKNSNDILYTPINQNMMLQCIVKIVPPSLFALEKQVELYSIRQKRILLKAKKNKLPVSTEFAVFNTHNHKIAVFQSNFSRTQYKYFEPTKQEQSTQVNQKHTQTTNFASTLIKLNPIPVQISSLSSKEKCYLVFRPNFFGTKQQRMKVIKPKVKVYKSSRFSDIKDSYENFQYDRLMIFESKLAQKNRKGQLVLDFKTKNIIQSSKNMMIEDENGDICLSFYKRKNNIYYLAIIHPFNIIEAFFIAVSNLDHSFF